jgi:hypothetical protein
VAARKPVYGVGWLNRPPSACRNSFRFMINEWSGNSEIKMSNCYIKICENISGKVTI